MRGQGLALKTISKTDREQRARKKGGHGFFVSNKFLNIFKRLHYKEFAEGKKLISKGGKFNPRDDLSKWHRIEAIDPKTGKARIFTFPVK